MTEVKSREPATRTRWRLGGALTVLAVATAIGAGGHPAFAAPKPAPGSGSAAGSAATAAGDHQARTAKQKATSTSSSGTGSASSATGTAAATKKPAATNTGSTTSKAPQPSRAMTRNDFRPEALTSNVTVVPGVAAATIAWAVGSGASPFHYVVIVGTVAAPTTPVGPGCDVPAAAARTCLAIGLTPGVSYVATVTEYDANNTVTAVDVGSSPAFIPLVASPPTTPLLTSTAGTLVVTWTLPALTAGIINYIATTSPAGGTCTGTGATTITCPITSGLTVGTAYTVTVVSTGNLSTGTSAASAASPSVILTSAPPTLVGLTSPATGGLVVGWTVPTANTQLSGYTATASPGGATCTATGGTAATCTIPSASLTSGVAYTATVVANATVPAGSSVASLASVPVVFGLSAAPTNVSAIMGNGQATVHWVTPAVAPLYFTATSVPGGKLCNSVNGTTLSCVVTGLTNTVQYNFTVVAHYTGGVDSAVSALSSPAIPMTIGLMAGANGKYVTAENAGDKPLIANRAAAGAWETFDVDVPDPLNPSVVALRARANGLTVTAENAGNLSLIARSHGAGLWETFTIVFNSDGSISLRAAVNGRYVCAENAGASPLIANRYTIGAWEKFSWVNLSS